MKKLILVLAFCVFGCWSPNHTYVPKGQGGTLVCPRCQRVIYDGPWELDSRGLHWPINEPNYCKKDDPLCLDKRIR